MEINQTPETVALTAACQLHKEILGGECFLGYDGTKEQFDRLFQELFVIARDEVSLEIDPVNQVTETFWDYQTEIVFGQRDCCWFY